MDQVQIEFENGDVFTINKVKLMNDFPEHRDLIESSEPLTLIEWFKGNFTFDSLTPYLIMIPKENYNYQLDFQLMS